MRMLDDIQGADTESPMAGEIAIAMAFMVPYRSIPEPIRSRGSRFVIQVERQTVQHEHHSWFYSNSFFSISAKAST